MQINTNGNSVSYASHLASHESNPFHMSHIWEFKELATRVAQEQIIEIVPQMINKAVSQAVSNALSNAFSGAMNGLSLDVERIVDITIEGLSKQYHSKEVDKFFGDALAEELRKALSDIDVKLIIS